ncbi:MAG TPA: GNAT family N-acetyltransferase [Anaerolineaceae bacterium]
MEPVEIRPLLGYKIETLEPYFIGYTTHAYYHVTLINSDQEAAIKMVLKPLPEPFTCRWDPLTAGAREHYQGILDQGYSFGAFLENHLIAIGIAAPVEWNRTFIVWEFHVLPEHQGKGIGRMLMEALAEKGRQSGMRTMLCETQNYNVNAIRFYCKMGFQIEAIDTSYYSNHDLEERQDVAIFMKRRLE